MIKLTDIAWLGGLLEGEGSFFWESYTHRQRGREYYYERPLISLFMTDADTVDRAARLLGNNSYVADYDKRANHKPGKKVQIYGKRAIGWMQTIYPFLGERRKAKVREIISKYKAYKINGLRYVKHVDKERGLDAPAT